MKIKRIYDIDKEDYIDMNKKGEIKNAIGVALSAAGMLAMMKMMEGNSQPEMLQWAGFVAGELGLTATAVYNLFAGFARLTEESNLKHGYTGLYDSSDLEEYRRKR